MTVESQNTSPENQTNLQEVINNQKQKDFEDILMMYEKMSLEEQKSFIEKLASRDPMFKELYEKLKGYFNSEITKLDNKEQGEKSKTEIGIEAEKTFNTMQNKMTFFEQNKEFQLSDHCFEEKILDGNNITILKTNVYSAYLRYNSNKEPLAKALGKSEITKAYEELQASLKASSNMPFAPQNMDASRIYVQNQYNEKVEKIIQKYIHIADNFVRLLNTTDIGKDILSNTALNNFDTKLKQSINKNISGKDNTNQEKLSNSIEIKTKILIGKISSLQNQLNKEIRDFKNGSQENLKQRDYITWERILYNDLPKRFEGLITKEIDNYAREVGKELVLSNSNIIIQGSVFNLPIGDKEVVLDFSELGNTQNKNTNEKLKLYENNFNKIYKNSLVSKIWRELTSKKGLVDISGIIIGGAMAAKFSAGTWGAGIPAATVIFTGTENAYRAGMYHVLGIEKGWSDGIGIDLENDKANDIFRKKGFELVSNGVLFGLFRASGIGKDTALKYMGNPNFTEKLSGKIITSGLKTSTEATFFTYYTIASNNLQESIKNGGNSKEMLKSFTNVGNMNDFMKLFSYNLGFITMVKTGGELAGKGEILFMQRKINSELQTLQEKGYFIVGSDFYKGNNKVQTLPADFQTLTELNKKLGHLAMDSYRKPESGRAGKTINTNQVNANKKYENLEKYSTQTQDGKISYALNDRTIGDTIQTNGLQKGKGVGEGLLKKSGFSNEEITQFREGKLKGEKANETKAINEMNKAMEVVYREYMEGLNKFMSGKSLSESYPNISKKILPKLETIITKELEIILPINNK